MHFGFHQSHMEMLTWEQFTLKCSFWWSFVLQSVKNVRVPWICVPYSYKAWPAASFFRRDHSSFFTQGKGWHGYIFQMSLGEIISIHLVLIGISVLLKDIAHSTWKVPVGSPLQYWLTVTYALMDPYNSALYSLWIFHLICYFYLVLLNIYSTEI